MADVSAQMNKLSQYRGELVDYVRKMSSQIASFGSDRNTWERRKRELEHLLANCSGKLTNLADEVANRQRDASRKVEKAETKHAHTADLARHVLGSPTEQAFPGDNQGSQVVSYIQREIQRCEQKIAEIAAAEARARANIDQANANIRTTDNNMRTLAQQAKEG